MKAPTSLMCSLIALLAAACGSDEPDVCEAAEAHFQECTGSSGADIRTSCEQNPANGEEVLSVSCDVLAASDKADGALFGKGLWDPCSLNLQCGDDLVCRPGYLPRDVRPDDEAEHMHVHRYCQPLGKAGEPCDLTGFDCEDGLSCKPPDVTVVIGIGDGIACGS